MNTLTQRLAVSALTDHLDVEMRAGAITPTLKLQHLIAKTRGAFPIQVGDHDAEYARVQDAVTNAMEE